MNCSEAQERLGLQVIGELSEAESEALNAHMAKCAACRELHGDLRVSLKLLRESLEAESPVLGEKARGSIPAEVVTPRLVKKPLAAKKRRPLRIYALRLAVAAALVLTLAAMLFPSIQEAKALSPATALKNQLRSEEMFNEAVGGEAPASRSTMELADRSGEEARWRYSPTKPSPATPLPSVQPPEKSESDVFYTREMNSVAETESAAPSARGQADTDAVETMPRIGRFGSGGGEQAGVFGWRSGGGRKRMANDEPKKEKDEDRQPSQPKPQAQDPAGDYGRYKQEAGVGGQMFVGAHAPDEQKAQRELRHEPLGDKRKEAESNALVLTPDDTGSMSRLERSTTTETPRTGENEKVIDEKSRGDVERAKETKENLALVTKRIADGFGPIGEVTTPSRTTQPDDRQREKDNQFTDFSDRRVYAITPHILPTTSPVGKETAPDKTVREEVISQLYAVRDLLGTDTHFPGPEFTINPNQPKNAEDEKGDASSHMSDKELLARLKSKLGINSTDGDRDDEQLDIRSGTLVTMTRPDIHQRIPKALEEIRTEHDREVTQAKAAAKISQQQQEASGSALSSATSREPDLLPASSFRPIPVNPFVLTETDRFSTFGLDVDTAAYRIAAKYIRRGFRPPQGAVRTEEFVNAFDYNYAAPTQGMFAVHATAAPSPFRAGLALVKVGLKARAVGREGRKAAHIVVVLDASGSMEKRDRMPLAKKALALLAQRLEARDRLTLVTFGADARLLLDAVGATERKRILDTVDAVQTGGTTYLAEGLRIGFDRAQRGFLTGGINRVILLSDGAANVGISEAGDLSDQVRKLHDWGIQFSCVGFGIGNVNDEVLSRLAQSGDGSYSFVDTIEEARRVFVDELTATLQTAARDAKIQVEFNPNRVRRYRLLGYEKRDVADADFRNDKVDGGEVGSGQSSTALFEVELVGDAREALGTVFVRYRDADTGRVEETAHGLPGALLSAASASSDPRFLLAAGAAEFSEILRGSEYARDSKPANVARILEEACAALPLDGRARELLDLVRRAEGLPQAP